MRARSSTAYRHRVVLQQVSSEETAPDDDTIAVVYSRSIGDGDTCWCVMSDHSSGATRHASVSVLLCRVWTRRVVCSFARANSHPLPEEHPL